MQAVNDYVRRPERAVLLVLVSLAGYIGRSWAHVSQLKLLELLRKHHGVRLSRRHLNRHLGALARDGYVRRIRTHRRGPGGRIDMHATIYAILGKAQRACGLVAPFFRRKLAALDAAARQVLASSAVTAPAQCGTPMSTIQAGGVAKRAPPSG
jgi:ribosomal protein L30/L7E